MASASEFRIAIFGESQDEKRKLSNFIAGKRDCSNSKMSKKCSHINGVWRKIPFKVVKTADVFNLTDESMRHEMKKCVAECHPGPNVLLLLVKPSDFSKEDRDRIEVMMSFFGQDAFKFSMVIITQNDREGNSSVDQFIQDCRQRHRIDVDKEDHPDCDRQELMEKIEYMVEENWGQYLSFAEETDSMDAPGCAKPTLTRHGSLLEAGYHYPRRQFQRMQLETASVRVPSRKSPRVPSRKSPRVPSRKSPGLPSIESPSVTSRKSPSVMSRESPSVTSSESPEVQGRGPTRMVQSRECLRMVLLGKTGCGKSATGNTILGQERFESKICLTSVTKLCKKETGEIDGRPVTVVDTPGLFDTTLTNDEIQQEILKCVRLLSPGPHVFLLVLPIGRYTPEQKDTVGLIKSFFGKKSEDFTFVVFTRGDELENQTIESYIADDEMGSLHKLTTECRGRYHVIDNNDQDNRCQVSQLLKKVESMVRENGGGYYKSDWCQEAEAAMQKEMEKITRVKEPEMQRKQRDLERKYQEELLEKERQLAELIFKLNLERKQRAKEKEEHLRKLVEEERKRERVKREEVINKKMQEELQRSEWEQKTKIGEKNLKYGISGRNSVTDWELLLQDRENMRKRREAWEQEIKDWWDKREHKQRQEEEQRRLAKLLYVHEFEKYENERKEDDRIRREYEERERRELEELYQSAKEMRKNEEEARKHAVKFKPISTMDLSAEMEKYGQGVMDLDKSKRLRRKKVYQKSFDELKKKQEQEMNELKLTHFYHTREDQNQKINELEQKHEEEIQSWIREHVKTASQHKACSIL